MLDIFVCGVNEVNDFIDEVDGVISIMTPGYTVYAPQSITKIENEDRYSVLRLEFDDVWQECYQLGQEMITPEIIDRVLDFAHSFVARFGDDSSLLVHCHEGISRSSAMAIAIYTSLYNEVNKAVARGTHQRPQAVPNVEVIRQTDALLNLSGELYDAVSSVFYFHDLNGSSSL